MLTLNLQNVEELVFYNKALQQAMPEFSNTFNNWAIGKRVPSLRFLCQKAMFEFLDSLTDEQVEKLSKILNDDIKIVRTDPHIVKTAVFDLECAACELNAWEGYENCFYYRDASKLYVCSWR